MKRIFHKILLFLIISSFLIDFSSSASCSNSNMKKTILSKYNSQDYGQANKSSMRLASREGASGIYFNDKFRINPRFEANIKVYFSAGRNDDDWAFDGFTILANKYNKGYITTQSYGGSICYYHMPYGFAAEADFYYNSEYNDRNAQTISIHNGITSARPYCSPYEDFYTSQSTINNMSYNSRKSYYMSLRLRYSNDRFDLSFNDDDSTSKSIDSSHRDYIKQGMYVGFTAFFRGDNRYMDIYEAFVCESIPNSIFSFMNDYNGYPGQVMTVLIQVRDYSNSIYSYVQSFDFEYSIYSNCSGAYVEAPYQHSEYEIGIKIYYCYKAGSYTLSGYLNVSGVKLNLSQAFSIDANSFNQIDSFKDSTNNCDRMTNYGSYKLLSCGSLDNGTYSTREVSNGVTFTFIPQDSYGNAFRNISYYDVNSNISIIYNNAKNISYSNAITQSGSSALVSLTISNLDIGSYYIYSSLYSYQRIYFNVAQNEPDMSSSYCSFSNFSSYPNISTSDSIQYICEISTKETSSLRKTVVEYLVSKQASYCNVYRDGALFKKINSAKDSSNTGRFICQLPSGDIGNFTVKPIYYDKSETEYTTKLNKYSVKGEPTNFSGLKYYDSNNSVFTSSSNNNLISINLETNYLTCLDFHLNNYSFNGFYKDSFLSSNKLTGVISNQETFNDRTYDTAELEFSYNVLNLSTCVLVKIKDNTTYLRRSSFNYIVSLKLNNFSWTLNLSYPLSTGGRTASAFPLDLSNTLMTKSFINPLIVGGTYDISLYELRTTSNKFYNYDISLSSLMNNSEFSCAYKNEANNDYSFNDYFSINEDSSIDGLFLIKAIGNKRKNTCSFYLKSNSENEDKLPIGTKVDVIFTHTQSVNEVIFAITPSDKVSNDDDIKFVIELKDIYGNIFDDTRTYDYATYFNLRFNLIINGSTVNFDNNSSTAIFSYNDKNKNYEIREYFKEAGNYQLVITMLSNNTSKTFSYAKTPGKISLEKSYLKLQSLEEFDTEGNTGIISLTMIDEYGSYLKQDEGVFNKFKNLVDVEVYYSGTTTSLNIAKIYDKNNDVYFETTEISDRALYKFYGYLYDTLDDKGKKNPDKRQSIIISGAYQFKYKLEDFYFPNTQVSIQLYNNLKMSTNQIVVVKKDIYFPIFSLFFYDKENKQVSYISILESEISIYFEYTEDNVVKKMNLQTEILSNRILARVSDSDGSYSAYNSLPKGKLNLNLVYSGKESHSLIYFVYLLSDDSTITDQEVNAKSTTFSITSYTSLAGDEQQINFDLFDSNYQRTTKAAGLKNSFIIKYKNPEDTNEDYKTIDTKLYSIQESNNDVGQYFLFLSLQIKGNYLIKIFSTDGSTVYGDYFSSEIKNNFLNNLILTSNDTSSLKEIDEYKELATINSGSTLTLKFKPVDKFLNVVDEVFDDSIFSETRTIKLFTLKEYFGKETTDSYANYMSPTISLSKQEQDSIIALKYTFNKISVVTLTSTNMSEKYLIHVNSSVFDLKYSYGELVQTSIVSGDSFDFKIYLRDIYNNVVKAEKNSSTLLSNIILSAYSINNTGERTVLSNLSKDSISYTEEDAFTFTIGDLKSNQLVEIIPLYNNAKINCYNCLLKIKEGEFVFSNSALYLNSDTISSTLIETTETNVLNKMILPIFNLYLRDFNSNNIKEISDSTLSLMSFSLLKSDDEEFKVAFCAKNNTNAVLIYICDKNANSISSYTNAINSEKYSFVISYKGNDNTLSYPMVISGNNNDDEADDSNVDTNFCDVSPTELNFTVGEYNRILIEIRTVNNKRKSGRLDLETSNPMGVEIASTSKNSINYYFTHADKQGQYYLYVTSTLSGSYSLNITYNSAELKASVVLNILPGIAQKALLLDKNPNESNDYKIIDSLLPSSIDKSYIIYVQLKDKYENNTLDNKFTYTLINKEIATSYKNLSVVSELIDLGNNNLSIVVNFEKASLKYYIKSDLFVDKENNEYNIQINSGVISPQNSVLIAPYDAKVNDISDIEILPRDKFLNPITINESNKLASTNFKLYYKTLNKQTNTYSSYLPVEQTSIFTDDSTNSNNSTYKFSITFTKSSYYYFRATDLNDIEISSENTITSVSQTSEYSLLKSSYYIYDSSSNQFTDITSYNGFISIKNTIELPIVKLVLRDSNNNILNELDLETIKSQLTVGLYNSSNILQSINFNLINSNSNIIIEIDSKSETSFKELSEDSYKIKINSTYSETNNFEFDLYLLGSAIPTDTDELDISKTIILNQNLEFKAGEQGSFTVLLRTSKGENYKDSWKSNLSLQDDKEYDDETQLKNIGVSNNSVQGSYTISFYVNKSNTYPSKAKYSRSVVLYITINNNLVKITELEILVNPGLISYVSLLNEFTSFDNNVYSIEDTNADISKKLTLKAYDGHNNVCETDMNKLKLKITDKDGLDASFTYSRNVIEGYQTVSIQNTKAGVYNISSLGKYFKIFKPNNVIIYISFTFNNKAGSLDLTNTVISNSNTQVIAGTLASLTISPKDKYNNTLLLNDVKDSIDVFIINPYGESSEIKTYDTENTYSSTLTVSGTNKWQITINNKLKPCSVCNVIVTPGEILLSNTKAMCSNIDGEYTLCSQNSSVTANSSTPSSIRFLFYDKYNNLFNSSVQDLIELANIKMSGNNMIEFNYPSEYDISYLNNNSVIQVSLNSSAVTEHSYLVSGKYINQINLKNKDTTMSFTYYTYISNSVDDYLYGNNIYIPTNTELITGTENYIVTNQITLSNEVYIILKNSEGKYYNRWIDTDKITINQAEYVQYTVTKTNIKSKYLITFSGVTNFVNDKSYTNIDIFVIDIKDSKVKIGKQIKFFATALQPPVKTTSLKLNVNPLKVSPSQQIMMTIKLYDKYGNAFIHNAMNLNYLKVLLSNGSVSPKSTNIVMNDLEDSYLVSFVPTYPPTTFTANLYYSNNGLFEGLLDDSVIPTFKIISEINYDNYVVSGSNLSHMTSGDLLDMIVEAYDSNKVCYNLTNKEATLTAEISGSETRSYSFEIVDSPYTGTCPRIYKIIVTESSKYTKIGTYTINIKRSGNPIVSPKYQTVKPGSVDINKFEIKWASKNFSVNSIPAGKLLTYTIKAYDSYDNQITEMISSKFETRVIDSSGNKLSHGSTTKDPLFFESDEKTLGILNNTFSLQKIGSYSIQYYYDNKLIDNSIIKSGPVSLMIVSSECDTKYPSITISKSSDLLIAGETVAFTITCYDVYNNRVTTGGAKFNASVVVKGVTGVIEDNSVKIVMKDNSDGSYSFSFLPVYAANYYASIILNDNLYDKETKFNVINSRCSGITPYECSNSSKCVADKYDCIEDISKQNCSDKTKPFYCEDSKICVKSRNECGCPKGYTKCPYNVPYDVCIPSGKEYELCPFYLPVNCQKIEWNLTYTCLNGICKTNSNEYSNKRVCPLGSVICPDLSCRSRLELCESYKVCNSNEITCPDLTCVSDQKDCPSQITCPKASQVVCPDGECVDNEYMCKL